LLEEIQKAIAEVQQPRSRFQLEKFVLGQHDTPEMKYYQVCIELQDMIFKLRMAEISQKKCEIKVLRFRESGDEIDELEAQELELGKEQTDLAISGAKREISHLADLWSGFEHKFTREEIEFAQPDYWKIRLTNTARTQLMSGAVNPAQIEALQQAGILEEFMEDTQGEIS